MNTSSASKYYQRYILENPKTLLVIMALITILAGYFATHFRLDASADTLVLENDQALKFYRTVKKNFGSQDSMVLTYSPQQDLFSEPVLDDIQRLGEQLGKLEHVDSVMSITNVPLIESPLVTLDELSQSIRTLADPDTDRGLARSELLNGPVYKDQIISADQKTTAILVTIARDERFHQLLTERNDLREKALDTPLTEAEQQRLKLVSQQFTAQSIKLSAKEAKLIDHIRELIQQHSHMAKMHLGGVPMITADSIAFVKNDLATFSVGIVAFIILILILAFRRTRWVILPMITCIVACVLMVGFLGLVDWPVTVVSSNFTSLMLIVTLSLTIHLIVRYRELQTEQPELDRASLVLGTMKLKFVPSFYTTFTTVVAFSSLIISEIRPIIDFGWMISIGVTVAFILSFTLFPAMLILLKPDKAITRGSSLVEKMSLKLAAKIHHLERPLLLLFIVLTLLSMVGISKLSVENRFIDYYKDSTEIYQGMELIDSKLGGTTPLDVVIDAPRSFFNPEEEAPVETTADEGFDEAFIEDYDDLLEQDNLGLTATSYWFNTYQLKQVARIHQYLDSLAESGKVLSLETSMAMLRKIDPQVADDSFLLAILFKKLPQDIKQNLFDPYMTADGNQIRFSIRLFESDRSLQRNELVEKIKTELVNELGLEPEQVHLTGMAVMYNNLLQSLFRSQILTIGFVFVAILLMFLVLFRSFKIAFITLIPNIISAAFILGIMGWLKIPMDLMTITIAAISIGIAVDDSIHYMHRFIDEYKVCGDYWQSIKACHGSIGQAMYFTSVTITLGFGLLVMSNFIPTIYFGLLTGFAMLVALFANLTLLPILIVRFKALG